MVAATVVPVTTSSHGSSHTRSRLPPPQGLLRAASEGDRVAPWDASQGGNRDFVRIVAASNFRVASSLSASDDAGAPILMNSGALMALHLLTMRSPGQQPAQFSAPEDRRGNQVSRYRSVALQ